MTDYHTALKEGWEERRSIQGSPTASILRYTTINEDPSIGVEGTQTLVPGLANLLVVVEEFSQRELLIGRGELDFKDRKFVFYDVTILPTDQISYGGETFRVYGLSQLPGGTRVEVMGKRIG